MSFDLNDKKFGGSVIFNNGQGGVAKDVEISIQKRKMEDPDSYPQYRLLANDGVATVNEGFYYPTPNKDKTDEENQKAAIREVGRVRHIATAVLGKDYNFPAVNSAKEAFDVLFDLIQDNLNGKKFNIFVTYGTTTWPDKYLGIRYFNFIEPAGPTKLKAGPKDLLERVEQDAPQQSEAEGWGV